MSRNTKIQVNFKPMLSRTGSNVYDLNAAQSRTGYWE